MAKFIETNLYLPKSHVCELSVEVARMLVHDFFLIDKDSAAIYQEYKMATGMFDFSVRDKANKILYRLKQITDEQSSEENNS